MNRQWIPMRWPVTWKDPAALGLLEGTKISCLLLEKGADLGPIADAAARAGITIADANAARVVKGDWPGVQMSAHGGDRASAGPTGAPWVDSNGWKVRLEAALDPGSSVWVDAPPEAPRLAAGAYPLAVADAAAHGGRWIVTLDDALAAGIANAQARALDRWKELGAATAFFSGHAAWLDCEPMAVTGVVSDFAGPNEFLSRELLNLLARANQQFRIILKDSAGRSSFQGLRALLYADAAAPAPGLRREVLAFVEAGGLLIAGPQWGPIGGAGDLVAGHPRYNVRPLGKGRIAAAKSEPDDPYILADDSVLLVSHRYELLRFWNAGAVGSYLTAAPDGKSAVAHLIFYASQGPRDASVRIAGRYRSARLWTLDRAEPRRMELHADRDGVELHLPPVNQYAAIELEG
jgi:hypothetical protein